MYKISKKNELHNEYYKGIIFSEPMMVFSTCKTYGKEEKSISRKKTGESLALLKAELKELELRGIPLLLEGAPSTPKKIIKAHKIAENGGYMRSYTADEKGVIQQLEFDFVKKESEF